MKFATDVMLRRNALASSVTCMYFGAVQCSDAAGTVAGRITKESAGRQTLRLLHLNALCITPPRTRIAYWDAHVHNSFSGTRPIRVIQ